ncbi:MAG: hypothetical protein EOO53_15230 [Gammaproteobacteria bacterium]|nr:MAG: hypothetical protein EOO53_15230 [Gammaproteobacteria bacterium]
MKLVVAFFLAAIIPALAIATWYLYGQFQSFEHDDPYIWVRTRNFFVMAFIVSSLYVFLLGTPTYYLLRYFNLVRWWSTLIAGFLLGAIPMAVLTWPLKNPEMKTNASFDGVQTMIDGLPTLAGWIQFIEGVSFFGACGLAASLVFWLVAPNKSLQHQSLRSLDSF